jgi:hypothetical protein
MPVAAASSGSRATRWLRRCGLHEIATMSRLSDILLGRAATSGLPGAPCYTLVRTAAEAHP